MKIISWNVNGIRAVERKGALDELLKNHDPDVLLLQEIKAKPEQLSTELTAHGEYEQFYHSAEKPGYAGTGVWVRKSLKVESPFAKASEDKESKSQRVEFLKSMPGFNDTEGRISRVDIGEWTIFGVYFPNGGKSAEAWQGKLKFYEDFLSHVNSLRAEGRRVIWGGDVNCAHQEIDLARAKENDGKIGFHPSERAWMDRVVGEGWVDIYRELHGEEVIYSWWDVITRARERNVGWRIDYFFIDQKDLSSVKDIQYLNDQMGSDHCPVMVEIS